MRTCVDALALPTELWTLVFGFLPRADLLRVRAVCRHFRGLVDSSGLWRDWTVELRAAKGAYKEHFWRTLRRWRVSAALLSAPRGWTHVAAHLPHLTALILCGYRQVRADTLRCFTRLRRLHLRQCALRVPLRTLLCLVPPRLTHMRLCACSGPVFDKPGFVALSRFSQLRSFVCHATFSFPPWFILHSILKNLPQLLHLSVSVKSPGPVPGPPEDLSLQEHGLCSLELVECSEWSLPADALRRLRRVRSLAVFFSADQACGCFGAWLAHLPALSSLLLAHAPPVAAFVDHMPSCVTRLALLPVRICPEEMEVLSARLPRLHHLHLEPRLPLGAHAALIPRLFPGLHSLRLRHRDVPEEVFLSLAALQELRLLETQDLDAAPAALAGRLQEVTKNRLRVSQKPEADRLWSCACTRYIPAQNWTITEAGPGLV